MKYLILIILVFYSFTFNKYLLINNLTSEDVKSKISYYLKPVHDINANKSYGKPENVHYLNYFTDPIKYLKVINKDFVYTRTTMSIFEYNDDEKLEKYTFINYDGSKEKEAYLYDKSRNITERILADKSIRWEYDPENRVIRENKWDEEITNYYYDDSLYVIELITNHKSKSKIKKTSKYSASYLLMDTHSEKTDDLLSINNTTYKYNNENKLIEYYSEDYNHGQTIITKVLYEYNSDGFPSSETILVGHKPINFIEYTYFIKEGKDAYSLTQEELYYSLSPKNLIKKKKTIYDFDSKGNWIESKTTIDGVLISKITREIQYFE